MKNTHKIIRQFVEDEWSKNSNKWMKLTGSLISYELGENKVGRALGLVHASTPNDQSDQPNVPDSTPNDPKDKS